MNAALAAAGRRPIETTIFAVLALITLLALIGPLITPADPILRVDPPFCAPSLAHLFGTDDVGRDLLSRVIAGVQITWLLSLLIIATFIDLEHFIIPNEITWGGVVAGIALSLALPGLMDVDSHLIGLLWSAAAAAAGYATLWLVVEIGKKAFGKKRIDLEKPEGFTWTRHGDDADLIAGGDTMKWSDLFSRPTDVLLMHVTEARIAGKTYQQTTLTFHYDRLLVESDGYELDKLDEISGVVTGLVIPREAMGFGDVKFIAAIGAFLGMRAVFFTITAGSVIGAVIGLLMILVGRREWSARIPFGPYLALGAVLWIFFGPDLLSAYWNWFQPGQI